MEKMKAFVRINVQSDEVELRDVSIPEIDEDEVLVKVQAFGVGIHDRYFIPNPIVFPYTIGSEATGIVTKKGSEVIEFQNGDRVILSSSLQPKGGCWAQYVAVSSKMLVSLPNEISFIEGASIPVVGKTALESMRTLDLKYGNTLFVAGASGAIGTFIIQMAKNQGIRVIGSASSKNHAYMLSLGAEKAVDYSNPDWKNQIKKWFPSGVDAALAIQPGTAKDSIEIVKDGGKVVTISGDRVEKTERNISVEQFQHQLDLNHVLNMMIKDIVDGKIHPVIEKVYSFEKALDALKKVETRHAKGKVVVSITEA